MFGFLGSKDPMFAFSGPGVKASSDKVQSSEDAQHVFPARTMVKEQVQRLIVQRGISALSCKGNPYHPVNDCSPIKIQGLATPEKHGVTKLPEER